MKQFLTEAQSRFKSAVPPFFRKLQVLGASVATLGTALQALSLPSNLLAVAGYIAVAGGVMVAVAQFAEKNIIAEKAEEAAEQPSQTINNPS